MRTKRQSQQKDAAPGGVAPVITVNWFNADVSGESGDVEVAAGAEDGRLAIPALCRLPPCGKVCAAGEG